MKRNIGVLLPLLLLVSLSVAAFAAADTDADSWTAAKSGFEIRIPDAFRDLKGYISFSDLGEGLDPGKGIVSANASYISMPVDEYNALRAEQAEAYENDDLEKMFELDEKLDPVQWELFSVYGINRGRGEKEIRAYLAEKYLNPDYFEGDDELLASVTTLYKNMEYREIGEKDGFRYYLCSYAPDDYAALFDLRGITPDSVYLAEFQALAAQNDLLADNVSLTGGVTLADVAEAGSKLRFDTTDLEGKPISSDEIFSGHKITMINMWATWCDPCKDELPALAKMAEDFEKRGCQIIGICLDAEDDETMAEGLKILKDAGVDYLNIAPFAGREELLPNQVYPTTYFVDEKGIVLDEVISGAMLSRYPQVLEKLLNALA